ncbi:MAG: helix-turn-helix domain-containing protein [Nitrososphaera sp.]
MDIRTRAVLLHTEGVKQAKEICTMYGISDRTLRRWVRAYESEGLEGIIPKKTGPKNAKQKMKK